ncbi:MAG: hypothetical protein JRN09_09835 [Nitrososphaerota archaeon]|nr:hypothetical protein [Nitrososphaerota archaeon]
MVALIKTAVDENTPNGQLEPGRVVPRKDGKKGYFVYIGVRRYLALRWLFGHTRDARFAVFYAYVDTGLTDLQMFLRAKMENEDGKGERQGLSVLEEIFGLSQIKDSLSPEKLKDGELRRLYELSSKLPQGKLKKLYDIERRTLSRFTVPQLERLVAVREEKDFFLTAASTSGFGFKGDDLEKAEQGREAAYTLEWFRDVFPEYASAAPRAARSPVRQQPDGEQQGGHLEVDEQAVILAPCPACSARSMVHAEGHMETRDIPPDPEQATVTSVAKTIGQNDRRCWKCGQRFYALVRHLEGRKYAADTALSDEFREPQTVVEAIDVRYDRTGKVWQQIVDGKIAGTVDLSGERTGAGEEGRG